MKKRWVMVFLAGVLTVVVAGVLVWRGEREPEYQGKKLSEWLLPQTNVQDLSQSANAVQQIGGKAVPWLLLWTDPRPWPPWKLRVFNWTKRFPAIQRTKAFQRIIGDANEKAYLQIAAIQAFRILGPEARGAIPTLTKRLDDRLEARSNGAAIALSHIGKDALPPLLSALSDESRSNRFVIARYIGYMRNLGDEANKAALVLIRCMTSNDKQLAVEAIGAFVRLRPSPELRSQALPVLIVCMEDEDKQVAGAAIGALGGLHAAPKLVFPALQKALHGEGAQRQALAMRAIGEYGERARELIPDLQELLNSGDWSLRKEATNALKKIRGEAVHEFQ